MISPQMIAQKLKRYLSLTHNVEDVCANPVKFKLFRSDIKDNFILIACDIDVISVYDETNLSALNIAISSEIDDMTIRSASYQIDKFLRNQFSEKQLPSCLAIHDYIILMANLCVARKFVNKIPEKNLGYAKSIFVSLDADDQNRYKMCIVGIANTNKIVATSYNVFKKNNTYEYVNDDSMDFFEHYIEEGDIKGYAALLLKTLNSPSGFRFL